MSNKQLSTERLESLLKDVVGELQVRYDRNTGLYYDPRLNAIYNENFKKEIDKKVLENLSYLKENYKKSLNANYEIKVL